MLTLLTREEMIVKFSMSTRDDGERDGDEASNHLLVHPPEGSTTCV